MGRGCFVSREGVCCAEGGAYGILWLRVHFPFFSEEGGILFGVATPPPLPADCTADSKCGNCISKTERFNACHYVWYTSEQQWLRKTNGIVALQYITLPIDVPF